KMANRQKPRALMRTSALFSRLWPPAFCSLMSLPARASQPRARTSVRRNVLLEEMGSNWPRAKKFRRSGGLKFALRSCGFPLVVFLSLEVTPVARAQNDAAGPVIGRIEVVQGKLEILRNGSAVWDATAAGVSLYGGDQLRVATNSRAV